MTKRADRGEKERKIKRRKRRERVRVIWFASNTFNEE